VAMGANDDQAVKEYWSTGHVIVLPLVAFFALVFVGIGTIFGSEWLKVTGSDASTLRWAMVWGGVGLFFAYYGQMWFVLSAAHLDFRFLSILRSSLAMITTLGTVGVALVFKDAAWLIAYSAFLGTVQFVFLLRRGNTQYRLPVRFRDFKKSRLLEMLPYTLKTFAQLISRSVIGSLDRVMLGRLSPASDFAAYNVSLNIGSRVQGLSQAAMGPIFCNTTRGVGGDLARNPAEIYRESFQMLFPWYGLVIVWVSVWSQPLLDLWLHKNAPVVGQSFPWIVAGCCLAAISNLAGSQLGPLNRVGTGLFFSLLSSGLSAILVIVGWYMDGLRGASIGFFLARLVFIAQDACVRKMLGFGYNSKDARALLETFLFLAICFAAHFATSVLGLSLLLQVTAAFLSGIICAAILLAPYIMRRGAV